MARPQSKETLREKFSKLLGISKGGPIKGPPSHSQKSEDFLITTALVKVRLRLFKGGIEQTYTPNGKKFAGKKWYYLLKKLPL